jgi:two-component system, NtrC family, response regulator AtoC
MLTGRNALVVEADAKTREQLESALRSLGYEVALTTSVEQALTELGRTPFSLTLLDATLDGRDGLELLRQLQSLGGDPGPVILIAAERDVMRVSEATALGAQEFVHRAFRPVDLENVIKEALSRPWRTWPRQQEGEDPAAQLQREVALCRSPRMREVWDVVTQAATVDVTVLIGGETGTGKDLVARAIHHFSSRRNAPLIKVNCAAVPRELLESELFGHERGAFTGAHQLKLGKFEAANRGTIFLDEIGDLHPALQAKLLHVLQDGTFSRVGGKSTIKVDVRVLAASNRDLEHEVTEQRFREDLYYRLNVIQIVVPPLRDRMEEVPLLANYFAQRYARLFRRSGFALSSTALERLAHHRFPGNVRELENLVKRMIVLDDPTLARTPFLRATPPAASEPTGNGGVAKAPRPTASLKEIARSAARAAERDAIARVLEETGWNRVRAARLLRVSYRALLYKIKDVGLERVAEPSS